MPDLCSSGHITMEQVYLGIDLVIPGTHLENGISSEQSKKNCKKLFTLLGNSEKRL